MKIKIKSIITFVIIISGMLIINWNFNLDAKNSIDNSNEFYIPKNDPFSNENIIWESVEVISESVLGQNFNSEFTKYPKIAVENHNVYVVWQEYNNTNGAGFDADICYRYFDGDLWSEIQVISEPIVGSNKNSGESRCPDIAVENGKIFVVWFDNNNTNGASTDYDIFFTCNITGTNWEPVQVISEPVSGENFNNGDNSSYPKIAVENGNIFVVWYDNNNTNKAGTDDDIFFRCNLTGSNWEGIQVISEPIQGENFNTVWSIYPSIAVENGKIYVTWADINNTNGAGGGDYDIFYKCNLTGIGWEPIKVISEPIPNNNFNIEHSNYPDIAVENEKIYIVWSDQNNTNGASQPGFDWDIFYRCNRIGFWEDIQVISEPIKGNNFNIGGSLASSISVENNKIYVVWHDSNNTNGSGIDNDIIFRCNHTGIGWEDIKVISEPIENNNLNTGLSSNPGIVLNLGKAHVVWFDTNNTNNAGTDEDIFYKSTFLSLALHTPSITPISGNTSTYFNFTVTYKNFDNMPPNEISVNISGTKYSIYEVDPADTIYIDGKDYYFNINQLNIGVHTYWFYASDGTSTGFTSHLSRPEVYNTVPNITTEDNLTALEDIYYEVFYKYEDIDVANVGQNIIWNFSTNASWLNFNTVTGLLYGTPNNSDVGKYWVNISINDTIEINFTNFTLTILNVNDDPIINTSNIKITYEDELYEIDYNATDVDSVINNQVWALDTNATTWLDIDPSAGIINGTPTNDEVGEYWVNVSVIDGDNGLAFTNFTLIVLNVNDLPEIITEDILIINTSELYEVDYNATDIDSPSSQFSWSVNTNASWLNIDATTGILGGTPLKIDVGWFNVNVTVDDGDNGQDWHEFILKVIKGNEPPFITTIDVVSATVNISYRVQYEATDIDTPLEKLSWSIETNASWLGIGPTTGILGGTPTLEDVGWYWVNVTVSDDEGGFDSHNFTVTVFATVNKPPKITTQDNPNAVVSEEYSVNYEAEDDRTLIDNLTWSLETNATWLKIDQKTGVLSGIPNTIDVGWYWVKVSVFDGEDGWDYCNFTLWVTKEPMTKLPPKLSNPKMVPTDGDTETDFTFSVDYSHPDDEEPDSIQVVIDGNPYNLTSSNSYYEYSTKLSEGNHTYYFTTTLGNFIVNTDEYQTGYIDKSTEVEPEDGDGDGTEDSTMLYALIGIIVVIIVVLILLFIFLKRKKEKEEPPVEEAQPSPQEEVPPEQVPTPEAPIPEQPPAPEVTPEKVPTPEVPPEQVPTPVTPPPEQPPTPEVTPQVEPQVEPAPQLAPMPQVEEQPQVSTPQFEQPQQPQVEAQEPTVEQPVEPQQQPAPTIKTQPTIEENDT